MWEYMADAFYEKPTSGPCGHKVDHALRWNQVKITDHSVALRFDHDKSGPNMKEQIIDWHVHDLHWNYKELLQKYIDMHPALEYFFCLEDSMLLCVNNVHDALDLLLLHTPWW